MSLQDTSEEGSHLDDDDDELFSDAKTLSQMRRSRIDLTRRYVFLCPTQLSKHFEVLPLQAKESALLVFRCSRNFLFKDPPSVRLTYLTPSEMWK
jgi:hypothetical protein